MIRYVLIWPEENLRKVSLPVEEVNPNLKGLIKDISASLLDMPYAVGLAAIQVGEPVRLFVSRNPHIKVYANPEILEYVTPGENMKEGCLSFPGVIEEISRSKSLKVRYQNIDPVTFEMSSMEETLTDLEAQIFQHELEHLDGKVLTDNLPKPRAKTITNRMNKLKTKGHRVTLYGQSF